MQSMTAKIATKGCGLGLPGQPIHDLGTIDVTSLTELIPPPNNWNLDSVIFEDADSLVSGLTPSETYFVVGDASNVIGRSECPIPITRFNSFFQAFLSTNEGTQGADTLLLADEDPTEWYSLEDINGSRHIQMSVTATTTSDLLGGDFDGDGLLTTADIDMLTREIHAGTNRSEFNLNGDALVDQDDLTAWLFDAAQFDQFAAAYLFGDANLDGAVNSADLNILALSWQQVDTPRWSAGDFNADGSVNSNDLNELALSWQQSIPVAPSASPVPEPSACLLAVVGFALAWRRTTRSRYPSGRCTVSSAT